MSQQLILLRTENDLLNSLIGQSFNQRTKLEAEKILTEIHSKAQDRSIGKMALCYIVDKNEIKGVGGSTLLKDKKSGEIISNLILDQFGVWLAGIFFRESTATKDVIMQDGSNIARTLRLKVVETGSIALFTARNVADFMGSQLQVGSGSTAPARTNFNIETAFGSAPENTRFIPPSDAVYNSGLGNFKLNGSISAGGSGTVNESILSVLWKDSGDIARAFALFRDIISPAQPFIVGQTIALEYTIQL